MVELKDIKMYVPAFRKAKEFDEWWFAFKAYAQHKGFRDVIKEEKHPDLPEIEESKSQTDEQKEALTMNKMAMASFSMAFSRYEGPECASFVMETIDDDWPSGKAWEVVTELLEEFVPNDLMGQVDQRRELNKIHIGKYENPKNLFAQITRIQNKYKDRCTALSEEDKLCAIICKAPEQYNNLILETRSQAIKATQKEPTLKELRKKMHTLWMQDQTSFSMRKKSKGAELSLYAGGESDEEGGRGKGRPKTNNSTKKCYHCGKMGHIKRECPLLNKAGTGKICAHCGKKGHSESECWKKHPEKRPKWLKDKGKDEMAAIAVDTELAFAIHDEEKEVQDKLEPSQSAEQNKAIDRLDPNLIQEGFIEVEASQDSEDERASQSSGFLVIDIDSNGSTNQQKPDNEAPKHAESDGKQLERAVHVSTEQQAAKQSQQKMMVDKMMDNKKKDNNNNKQKHHCQDCSTKLHRRSECRKSYSLNQRKNERNNKRRKRVKRKTDKIGTNQTWKPVGNVPGPKLNRSRSDVASNKGGQRMMTTQRKGKFQQSKANIRKFRNQRKDKWGHVAHETQNRRNTATANGWYRAPKITQNRFMYNCTKNERRKVRERETKCNRANHDSRAKTTVTTQVGPVKITVETMPAVKPDRVRKFRVRHCRGYANFGEEIPIINLNASDFENNPAETAFLNTETSDQTNEKHLGVANAASMLYSPVIWVADTGASCHITNSDEGSIPARSAGARLLSMKDSVDASGNTMKTSKIIDIKGTVRNSRGKCTNIKLTNCRFGSSKFNLCSLTKMTENGWTMTGDKHGIRLCKGEAEVHFDIPIKTAEGRLWAARIDRRAPDNDEHEFTLATPTTLNLNKAHTFCGHSNLRDTRKTAAELGWTITRTPFVRCEACAIAKARQANLGDGEGKEPKKIGELWYVDGLQLKRPKPSKKRRTNVHFPSNNCFTLGVEHKTGAVIHSWATTKTGFIDHFCREFHSLNQRHNREVKRIRCDDGRENTKFQQKINGEPWTMAIQFEFTAKTPQRNSRVETKLFNICNKTRAALEAANVPDTHRYVLFALFSKWICQTDMLQVVEVDGKSTTKYQHIVGALPGWTAHMQVAGMAGVVKTHTQGTPKVDARGKTCMFVHYAKDHAKDCYVMFDPNTLRIIHSRDVLWLDRMYYTKARAHPGAQIIVNGPRVPIVQPVDEGSDSDTSSTADNSASDSDSDRDTADNDESDDEDNEISSASNTSDQDWLGDNWQHPNEEIIFDQDSDEEARPTTRSGRTIRRRKAHDGTTLVAPTKGSRTQTAPQTNPEILAAAIEDDYVEAIGSLGVEELRRTTPEFKDESMEEEEFVLLHLTKGETLYTSIEYAFGYVDADNNHRLTAAALATIDHELHLVGATGHNYGNTAELNVMTYKQAMATVDKAEWEKAVKVEHDKMTKYNVFKVVHPRDIPKGTKIFDSTWAMKKKADGTFRARNAIRGFQQVDGAHYDSQDKSSPVATEVGIRIVFVLALLAQYYQHLVDVEGAFLNGEFQHPDKHKMFMAVPEAFKQWYPPWAVFLLLKTQYGTIQAALQYYRECCKALAFLKFKRNPAEPCIFYKWTDGRLVLFVLWVDDCCVTGPKDLVMKTVEEFKSLWDCKDLGELKEYVGCKVERTSEWIRLTQPVKVQRFMDEFNCTGDNGPSNRAPSTPAEPGSVLEFNKETDKPLKPALQTEYRSGVGILLHMMRWSRPDVLNAVRELSTHMQQASKDCLKALRRVMNFIVSTKDRGFTFRVENPGKWDGRRESKEFRIVGKCDSEYAKHSSRRSVNAGITYLEGAVVKQFSKMMPIVALSTTEAELYSAVMTAQDMMFVYHVLRGMGLRVTLPMILYCDNKGAVDLANNWSVGGRTRHVDVKQNFLRELKDHGFLQVEWRSGEDMTPDMHTKNVSKLLFDRYSAELVS